MTINCSGRKYAPLANMGGTQSHCSIKVARTTFSVLDEAFDRGKQILLSLCASCSGPKQTKELQVLELDNCIQQKDYNKAAYMKQIPVIAIMISGWLAWQKSTPIPSHSWSRNLNDMNISESSRSFSHSILRMNNAVRRWSFQGDFKLYFPRVLLPQI